MQFLHFPNTIINIAVLLYSADGKVRNNWPDKINVIKLTGQVR